MGSPGAPFGYKLGSTKGLNDRRVTAKQSDQNDSHANYTDVDKRL